jgi:O-antigen/teichoic acid export membrane protein
MLGIIMQSLDKDINDPCSVSGAESYSKHKGSPPTSLRVNFTWAFVANVVSAFSGWVLLVLLTKMATAEVVGTLAIAQAVGLPISMLLTLKLQVVQVTDAKSDYAFGHYYALRIITAILTTFLIPIVGFLFCPLEVALVVTALGIGYAIVSLKELFLAVMQKSERMGRVAISRIIGGVLSVSAFAVLFWFSKSLVLGVTGLVISRFIVLCFYDMPVARKLLTLQTESEKSFAPHWHRAVIWKLIKLAAPLAGVAWFGTLATSLPRLIMGKTIGVAQVGYFAAISSLLVAGKMIMIALNQSVSPRLAKYYFTNIKAYKWLLLKLLGVGIAVGISGILISIMFGKFILTLLFKPDYAEHNNIFVGVAIAGAILFLWTFTTCGLNSARKFKIQLPICALTAVVGGFSSLWLIPRLGMMGGVWSISLAYSFATVSSAIFVIRAIKEKTHKH